MLFEHLSILYIQGTKLYIVHISVFTTRILSKCGFLATKCCEVKNNFSSVLNCPMLQSGQFPFLYKFFGNYIWAWVCPHLVFSSFSCYLLIFANIYSS